MFVWLQVKVRLAWWFGEPQGLLVNCAGKAFVFEMKAYMYVSLFFPEMLDITTESTLEELNTSFVPSTHKPPPPRNKECELYHELQPLLGPYCVPMLIEFCVVSATMLLVIWENSGVGYSVDNGRETNGKTPDMVVREKSSSDVRSAIRNGSFSRFRNNSLYSVLSVSYELKSNKHYNSYFGFMSGWTAICVTAGAVVLCTYSQYKHYTEMEMVPYYLNIGLSVVSVVACVYTFICLAKLTYEDEEIKEAAENEKGESHTTEVKDRVDGQLAVVTLIALVAWKVFSIIAGFDGVQNSIIADGITSILFAFTQSFCLFYAQKKRVKTRAQLLDKPGKQGMEFLRLVNFALWLNNTFLLKQALAKEAMFETFGVMEWAILSNVFQPLAILFYFHAMLISARAMNNIYSSKYVGTVRQSKQRLSLTPVAEADNEAFEGDQED